MLSALILFAQVAQDVKKEAEAQPDMPFYQNPMFILMALMGLFFFVVILPAQRKQKREQASLLSNMKKNDEVVTASGIIGVISHIKETGDEVTLKIDDNGARIRVLKSSIARIVPKDEPAAAPSDTNAKPT